MSDYTAACLLALIALTALGLLFYTLHLVAQYLNQRDSEGRDQ